MLDTITIHNSHAEAGTSTNLRKCMHSLFRGCND